MTGEHNGPRSAWVYRGGGWRPVVVLPRPRGGAWAVGLGPPVRLWRLSAREATALRPCRQSPARTVQSLRAVGRRYGITAEARRLLDEVAGRGRAPR